AERPRSRGLLRGRPGRGAIQQFCRDVSRRRRYMKQSKIVLYVALVFASGVVLGVFGHRFYAATSVDAKGPAVTAKPASFRARYMEESQRRLNLTEAQLTKLMQIFDDTRERMDEVNHRMEPVMQAIRNEQIDKIRAMLTPEQLIEYEKLRHERDERARQKAQAKAAAK